MKKFSLYIVMAVSLLASCSPDDDHIFDKSPEERINEVMGRYQAAIAGAVDGWQGQIITGDSSYFSFYFRFNNDNRVWMMSDYSRETADALRESSYRMKALQNPTLIFDTYSYLHILADPDAAVNGGSYGSGRVSDFEYTIDTATTDSIHLTGRFNSTVMVLKKATAQQRAAWENKQIRDGIVSLGNIKNILHYFKRITLNSTPYEIKVDTFSKRITLTWVKGGVPNTVTRGYYVVPGGIQFVDPIVGDGITIPGMTVGNFSGNQLNVTVNGANAAITGSNSGPMVADTSAFTRFKNLPITNGTYWATEDAFHVDGVDDAFNVKSLKTDTSTYIYTLYWPNFNPGIDLLAPIYFHNTERRAQLLYGQGIVTSNLGDGRARMRDMYTFGTYPTSGPAFAQRQQFSISGQNYWFIQTGTYSYDMVSAVDAKVWISWFLF